MIAIRSRQSRGFSLLEAMLFVGMLAFISTVTAHLFRTTVRTWHDTAARQTAHTRFDTALRQLREDVWSATSITITDKHAMLLHGPGGVEVGWRSLPSGALTRMETGTSAPREWDGLGEFSFAVEGPNVTVTQSGDRGSQVVLTSQAMQLEGAAR